MFLFCVHKFVCSFKFYVHSNVPAHHDSLHISSLLAFYTRRRQRSHTRPSSQTSNNPGKRHKHNKTHPHNAALQHQKKKTVAKRQNTATTTSRSVFFFFIGGWVKLKLKLTNLRDLKYMSCVIAFCKTNTTHAWDRPATPTTYRFGAGAAYNTTEASASYNNSRAETPEAPGSYTIQRVETLEAPGSRLDDLDKRRQKLRHGDHRAWASPQ